jgi:dihydrofolate reductase
MTTYQGTIIVAMSPERIIGVAGKIPWKYQGDFKRFKRVTMGGALIMGRRTWESIGRPLPGRKNIVVSASGAMYTPDGFTQINPGVMVAKSLAQAIELAGGDPVWFIGGTRIYEEALKVAEFIDMTYVPDRIVSAPEETATFPIFDESEWFVGEMVVHEDEPALSRRAYVRRPCAIKPA